MLPIKIIEHAAKMNEPDLRTALEWFLELDAQLHHYRNGDFLSRPICSEPDATTRIANAIIQLYELSKTEGNEYLTPVIPVLVTEINKREIELTELWKTIEEPAFDYHEYLKSEHWQETRKAALKRADYRCQVCNGTKRLEVHHRTYERLWMENDADLTVLCDECHGLFHKNRRLQK
jgi:hypothetical protein